MQYRLEDQYIYGKKVSISYFFSFLFPTEMLRFGWLRKNDIGRGAFDDSGL